MKEMAPKDARTIAQVCRLQSDNHSTPSAWILLDHGDAVVLCTQRNGEPSTASVRISRAEFNRLVKWYTKPQRLTSTVAVSPP